MRASQPLEPILDSLGGASERLTEYNDPVGLWELRQLITNLLGPARGMVVFAEQVLIVAGCQHGVNLVAHLSVGTNTPAVVESPCYRLPGLPFDFTRGTVPHASG